MMKFRLIISFLNLIGQHLHLRTTIVQLTELTSIHRTWNYLTESQQTAVPP
ncbi:hypothetical protein I8748_30245 [Nostoc sp. CENA67]|uniref:Uncharacterized protein n=1 Tax=Amazonocrinis nigriterrae CENA67 TaxID=2794033 RepID=A0A8J7LCD3_9NOST|nr:hypothetical protein [Amazonocrinis nigriterrae]MBH8566386.1 hypothetical protein [Amazonocrinis nigriterrae CENA67]